MFNDAVVQWKIHWFTSLKISLYVHYTKNENVPCLPDIQLLLCNAKKCNCTISSAFKNKVSPHRIYFSSRLHYKSKFRQNPNLPLCILTLWFQKENFRGRKNKKFISLKVAHSKFPNSLRVRYMFTFHLYQKIIIFWYILSFRNIHQNHTQM